MNSVEHGKSTGNFYIELMSRILGEKDTKINYKSSLIESIKELESQKSKKKEENRKNY